MTGEDAERIARKIDEAVGFRLTLRCYVLDRRGDARVAPSMVALGEMFEDIRARRVAQTRVGPVTVSTVFLGTDRRFSRTGPPVLWETMTFGYVRGWDDFYQTRYTSRTAALCGHRAAVAELRALRRARVMARQRPPKRVSRRSMRARRKGLGLYHPLEAGP